MNSVYLPQRIKYTAVACVISTCFSLHAFCQQVWTQVPTPDTSTTRTMLRGISGTSSTDIWAVGAFDETLTGPPYLVEKNLAMHWDGTGWRIVPVPSPSLTLNDLWDVRAISTNDVWAVGEQNDNGAGATQAEIVHWDGVSWSQVPVPVIPGGAGLFGIDDISPNDIWAVGYRSGSPTRPAFALHYDGSSWNEVAVPPVGLYYNRLNDVSGIASNDVWIVGNKADAYGEYYPLAMHWNGAAWTNTTLPPSINTVQGELLSVSMVSANDVWAVGSTVTGLLIKIHWDGVSWTEVVPGGGGGGAFAVRGPADIFGVGSEITHWDGIAWTVIDSLSQLSYPALVATVSFPNGDIWAAGRTWTTDNVFHSLVYRTANARPAFTHGSNPVVTINMNSASSIDSLLQVADGDIAQTLIYSIVESPAHGTINGLPDTAITVNGFAQTNGVSYTPDPGFVGSDNFILRVAVGALQADVSITVNIGSVIPVKFLNLQAEKLGNAVRLKWTSIGAKAGDVYIIERGAAPADFQSITTIADAPPTRVHFDAIDNHPLSGANYYRIRCESPDGSRSYSQVTMIQYKPAAFSVYPNPVVNGKVKMTIPGQSGIVIAKLYNAAGQVLLNTKLQIWENNAEIILPSGITAGTYHLRVIAQGKQIDETIFVR